MSTFGNLDPQYTTYKNIAKNALFGIIAPTPANAEGANLLSIHVIGAGSTYDRTAKGVLYDTSGNFLGESLPLTVGIVYQERIFDFSVQPVLSGLTSYLLGIISNNTYWRIRFLDVVTTEAWSYEGNTYDDPQPIPGYTTWERRPLIWGTYDSVISSNVIFPKSSRHIGAR